MQRRSDHITPTPERRRHSGIEILDRAIADDAGRPSQPYRSIDILAALERRGAITHEMWAAGDRFRSTFRRAQIDPLKAANWLHIRGGETEPAASRAENAQRSIRHAIHALGPQGGSCLWHVLGWEQSVSQWAMQQSWSRRRVSIDVATGIFIAALGVLVAHYERGS